MGPLIRYGTSDDVQWEDSEFGSGWDVSEMASRYPVGGDPYTVNCEALKILGGIIH